MIAACPPHVSSKINRPWQGLFTTRSECLENPCSHEDSLPIEGLAPEILTFVRICFENKNASRRRHSHLQTIWPTYLCQRSPIFAN